jgi:hypothetical protein
MAKAEKAEASKYVANKQRAERREEREQELAAKIASKNLELPSKVYGVILADPNGSSRCGRKRQGLSCRRLAVDWVLCYFCNLDSRNVRNATMKRICQTLAAILSMTFGGYALASPETNARVTYVGVYGSGELFVGLDRDISEPGCTKNRFDVSGSHPQVSHFLEIALAAIASFSTGDPSKSVVVATHGCLGQWPTIDNTNESFFYMFAVP